MIKKLYYYFLLLIPLLTISQTTWNFNNSSDGWTATSSSLTNLQSSLRVVTSSLNPTLSNTTSGINATTNKWIAVTLKSGINAPTFLRISYPKPDQTRVYVNSVITNNDVGFKTYYFDMTSLNWTGTINDLKLHFKLNDGTPAGGNFTGTSTIDIDKIEVTPFKMLNLYGFNSGNEDWVVSGGTAQNQNGNLIITPTDQTITKIEQSYGGINTSLTKYVHVVYKNTSTNNRLRFQYQNSVDNYVSFKGQNANINSNMSDYGVVTFDFSNNTTDWTGYIKKLQIIIQNTSNTGNVASTGDIYIDKIIISDQASLSNFKLNQSISFPTLRKYALSEGSFEYFITSSSGLPVALTSVNSNVASVSGDYVTLAQGGQTILTASQVGNEFYNEASQVSNQLTVVQNIATWNFTSLTPVNQASLLTVSDLSVNNSMSTDGVIGINLVSNYSNASGGSNLQVGCLKGALVLGANGSSYVEFTITPSSNYKFILTDFNFGYRSGLSGPTNFVIRSSFDNYQSNLIQGVLNNTATWYYINNELVSLQEFLSGTTYRIYFYGGLNNSGATSNFKMDDFTVIGYAMQIPAPVITSSLNASGTVGQAFNYATTALNVPSSFSAQGLPSGLSINSTTGVISGTPSVAGTFNVSLSATNLTGTDTKVVVISVAKAEQVITFGPLSAKTYGDLSFSLNGTASSGLAVTYTSSNPSVATISGNTVTIVGAGTTSITATQLGNENYNAASGVSQNLVVNKANQTITFGTLPNKNDTDGSFTLLATASSGLPVSFTSENNSIVSISGNVATIVGSGTVVINALQEGDSNYYPAQTISQNQIIVNTSLSSQEITFDTLIDRVYGDAPFTLNAVASSGLAITYTSSDESIATINGNIVTILKPGTVIITASQEGNNTYNFALPVTQNLLISNKELTVSNVIVADKSYNGTNTAIISSYQLNGVVGSDDVVLTNEAIFAQTTVGQNIAVTPNFVLAGLQADRYTLVQPTNVTGSIIKGDQTIVFDVLPSKVYGDVPFVLNATGGASGQPIVFTSSNESIATVSGNQVTVLAVGTVEITASQLGNEQYNDAISITQTLIINKAPQTISNFISPGIKYLNSQPVVLTAISSSGLPITYTSANENIVSFSGNIMTIVGLGSTQIYAHQEGNQNYEAAISVERNVTIAPNPIAAWNLTGLNHTSSNPIISATATLFTNLVSLNSGNLLTRGPSAPSSSGANAFRTTGFKNDGISVNNQDYFQFKLQPSEGYQLSLTSINCFVGGTNTFYASPGVTSQFAYSLNGTNFTLIGQPQTSGLLVLDPVDLSQISELQNIQNGTTVTFRYYASGQTIDGGWGFRSPSSDSDALAIGGTLVALPATPQITTTQNCNGTVMLSTEATGSLLWSTGETTSSITVTNLGNYTVTQTVNGVTSYPATVNVTPITSTPPIVENQVFCATEMPKVADILTQGQNIKVYSDSEKTNLLNANQELVSGDYYITQTIGTCESEVTQVQITVNAAITYYVDADGDGYGSTTTAMLCSVTTPAGYATNNTDCDDANALVWQSASFYVDADADGFDNGSATVCYGATTPVGYATTTNGSDCDDANALVWQTGSFYADADADTYGAGELVSLCYGATIPSGYSINNTDCDDSNNLVWYIGSLFVDFDNDGFDNGSVNLCCGNIIPSGYATTSNGSDCDDANALVWQTGSFYVDADADTYGTGELVSLCYGANTPAGYAVNNTDCDDTNAQIWRSATFYVDADADGYDNGSATVCYGATIPVGYATTTNGSDCNDANAAIHATVMYYVDADGDGYGSTTTAMLCSATAPTGYATNNTDCDDANALVWQSASFYVDADADGYDNGSATVCYGATTPVGYATTTNGSDCNDSNAAIHTTVLYYVDADGDGYGSTTTAMLCSLTAPAGYATNNTDCDDANAQVWRSASFYVDADADGYDNGSATVCYGATTPVGYATTTNGSDCNDSNAAIHATVLYYLDADGDGYGSTTTAMLCSLTAPAGYATNNTDCDDANAQVWRSASFYVDADADGYNNGSATVCYGATTPVGYATTTNGVDCNDANAQVWRTGSFYVDADGDTYGTGTAVSVCYGSATPSGYSTNNTDCNDSNAQVWRTGSFYVDTDGDTYGTGTAVSVCYGSTTPSGYATRAGDCNNSNASVNPGATEICGNGIDDNCNGSIDEGCVVTTKIQDSQCGATLAALNTPIYVDVIPGATTYRYEVSGGGYASPRIFTAIDGINYFNLTQVSGGANFETTYSVRVAYKLAGVWKAYGTACNVTTPTPITKVRDSQCGVTLDAVTITIYADPVALVNAYRFEVTNGTTVRTFDTANGATNSFKLTQLTGGATLGMSYSVRVAVKYPSGAWGPFGPACMVYTQSTKVQASQCGITLDTPNTMIYADAIASAEAYRFEVTNGTTVRTYETASSAINYFKLTQLTGSIPYSTAYSIRVATKYAGIWGDYGQSCTVSTGAALTKVQLSQCGSTLSSISESIYVDEIIGATTYRYEVSGGGYASPRIFTAVDGINYFNLTQVSGGAAYQTTYSIRVAYKLGGVWKSYGSACTITTPQPQTKVKSTQCGVTLAAISTYIYADVAYGALGYRFEVTNGTTVRTFETTSSANYYFNLTQLSGGAMYSTTYAIRVAVKYGSGVWGPYGTSCNVTTPGVTTNVFPSQCGVTLPSIVTTINAVAIADPLITAYRFEVTNGSTVRNYTTADGATSYFKLIQVSGGALFNTTYAIRVAVKYNGIWQAFGPSCNVTTPAVQTIKVISSQCGLTVSPSTVIRSEYPVVSATKYRFELTDGSTVLTYENVANTFRFVDVAGYRMGATYSVRVAYQYLGIWFDYGQACNIALPSPLTKVQASRCGTTVNVATTISTDALSITPSKYRFQLTAGATVLTYENTTNSFRFKDVVGYQMGTAYSVRVATLYNNVWYPYGESCVITTEGTAPTVRVEQEKEVAVSAPIFSVKGYPNPYNTYFVLSLETPSESKVGVRVFDMAGKLIEEKEIEPARLESLQLGANWPLGVYNIIVTQDAQVKTIKMVKNE